MNYTSHSCVRKPTMWVVKKNEFFTIQTREQHQIPPRYENIRVGDSLIGFLSESLKFVSKRAKE